MNAQSNFVIKSVLGLALLFTMLSPSVGFGQIRKPRPPSAPSNPGRPGIGHMEQQQKIVRDFMNHVGWNDSEEYEETGLLMKDLLFNAVKNREAKAWLLEVNAYFESAEFKKLSKKKKKEEVFQAKLLAKATIQELDLLNPPPKRKLIQ